MDDADDLAAEPRRSGAQSVLLYVLLVVIPALGVGWTLRVGERLQAPTPVHGTWTIDPDAAGCERAAATLTLAQSGHRVDGVVTTASGREARLTGRIEGSRLRLASPADGCEAVEAELSRPLADSVASMRATVQSGACGCRATEAALRRAAAAPSDDDAH